MSVNQKLTCQEKRTLLGRHMVWVEQWKRGELVRLKCRTCKGDVQESGKDKVKTKHSLGEIVELCWMRV